MFHFFFFLCISCPFADKKLRQKPQKQSSCNFSRRDVLKKNVILHSFREPVSYTPFHGQVVKLLLILQGERCRDDITPLLGPPFGMKKWGVSFVEKCVYIQKINLLIQKMKRCLKKHRIFAPEIWKDYQERLFSS